MKLEPSPRTRSSAWLGVLAGIALGTGYGVLARGLAERGLVFDVMSVAFLFAVPVAMGALSVLPLARPTWVHAVGLPVLSCAGTLAIAMASGWEGLICVAMALAPLVLASILGGIVALLVVLVVKGVSNRKGPPALAVLPFLLAWGERGLESPVSTRVVADAIEIAAPPSAVWEEIVEVPPIRPDERRPALFTTLGFPAPTSAIVDRRAVGGVREARFEGGVLFLERITVFEPEHKLEFTIDAQEELIPPTTLDPHVTIGGPFFDVLLGTYELEPMEHGTRLHLTSRLRVSTRFNVYAGAWADLVMESIQDNILEVVRRRAEARAATAR
ncbi:MAG: hypothetical protein IPJ77_00920 [Planctomycetes bacterium]|nr:hypothetical protein [Planctomycetota bacterium]